MKLEEQLKILRPERVRVPSGSLVRVDMTSFRKLSDMVGKPMFAKHWWVSLNTRVGVTLKALTPESGKALGVYLAKQTTRPVAMEQKYNAEDLAGGTPETGKWYKSMEDSTVTYTKEIPESQAISPSGKGMGLGVILIACVIALWYFLSGRRG